MKLLLALISLSMGVAAVVQTVDWMNDASTVMEQATQLTR